MDIPRRGVVFYLEYCDLYETRKMGRTVGLGSLIFFIDSYLGQVQKVSVYECASM